MTGFARTLLLAAALGPGFAAGVHAHDSWLRPAEGGSARLELATGNRFPRAEFPTNPATLVQPACSDGSSRFALRPAEVLETSLVLQAAPGSRPLLACWAEIAEWTVAMEPRIVAIYLDEIHASPEVRATWADQQARGFAWHERYRKFARIEFAAPQATPAARAAARRPVGQGLELVVLGEQPLAAGSPLEFRLLRDGRPLPGFPIELVSERNALGIWRSTDADGVLRHTLPFGGAWLLRGVDLRAAPNAADGWDSRFVTLVLQLP